MTILPAPPRLIVPCEGEPYEVPTVCAQPFCGAVATDGHHISRRSFLTTGFWVEIDGVRVGNIASLCQEHHLHVTGGINGHQARIQWDAEQLQYLWLVRDGDAWEALGELDPHPPFPSDRAAAGPPHESSLSAHGASSLGGGSIGRDDAEHGRDDSLSVPDRVQAHAEDLTMAVPPGSTCPTCERRVPHPPKETSPKDTRQLNLGKAPVELVDALHGSLEDFAARAGLSERPFWRHKALDVLLDLGNAVDEETLVAMTETKPWA